MPSNVNLNPVNILYNADGNAVGVIQDGSVYRLQVEATVVSGADPYVGGVVTISQEHHEIHKGNHYFVEQITEVSGSGSTLKIGIGVAADCYPHMAFRIIGEQAFSVRLLEGSTYSGGTTLTPVNNNRNSTNTSNVVVVTNPTVTVDGTMLLESIVAFNSAAIQAGGVHDRQSEIILKPRTKYVLQITRNAAGAGQLTYLINWYE